jgi:phosphopantetheine--protein transferase-like protein
LILVGNDIVDLSNAPTNKQNDIRFMQRVFTQEEQSLINTTLNINPNIMVWLLWAAKESAYKIIAKLFKQPSFIHKKFQISIVKNEISSSDITLKAVYDNYTMQLQATISSSYIHMLAIYSDLKDNSNLELNLNLDLKSNIRKISSNEINLWDTNNQVSNSFTQQERLSIKNVFSEVVRLDLKQAIANQFNLELSSLEIIRTNTNNRMNPPFLLINGELSPINLSLSHHGDWVAWALIPPPKS